ncbi:MAG: hypothetical protein ABR907_10030 [Terracidiphilus sp.]|jgi:hypothetical protein
MNLPRIGMAIVSLFLFAASSSALPSHTWVSAAGNDANTGTALSPYADFATAVANTAPGGFVSVMGPGDYGPLTITQSITIDGTNGGSIGFAGDGEAIYIDAGANANVILRNLTLDGGGTGSDAIFVASAGTTNIVNVVIDGCHIEGFSQIGVGLGSESPMYVTVRNTTIQGGSLGVRTFQNGTVAPITSNDHVLLDHVTIQGATTAGVFTRNGNMDISNSSITGSVGAGAVGIQADTYATLNVQSTMITSNTNGACIYANSTATIGASTLMADNGANIEACGGVVQGMAGAAPSPKLSAPASHP